MLIRNMLIKYYSAAGGEGGDGGGSGSGAPEITPEIQKLIDEQVSAQVSGLKIKIVSYSVSSKSPLSRLSVLMVSILTR